MKRLLIASLLTVITCMVCAQGISFNGPKPDLVVDVRTPAEFASGHIEGAINIPLERLRTDTNTMQGFAKDSRILVYCRSGRRSAEAVTILKWQGFQNIQDGGGIAPP